MAATTKRGLAMALLWTMVVAALAAVVYRLEIGLVAFKKGNFGGSSVVVVADDVSRRRGSRIKEEKSASSSSLSLEEKREGAPDDDNNNIDDDGEFGASTKGQQPPLTRRRKRRRREREQEQQPPEDEKMPEFSSGIGFGCVHIESERFVREMCMLDVRLDESEEYKGYKKMSARLTVRKKSKKNSSSSNSDENEENFEWSCGDSVRVAFETSEAFFGPMNAPIFEEREEDGEKVCGEFPVEAIIPREGDRYRGVRAKVWLLHVDGEGLKDPEIEKPFPENLMSKANNCPPCDGPIVYNIRRTFPRRVYVDEKDYFVSENMEEDVGVGEFALEDAAGFTESYKNIKKNESTHGWYKMEAYKELHENPAEEIAWRREGAKIPFCKNGDGAGRWVFSKKMYRTQSEEDALEWRYYGCKIKHVPGLKLKGCLERIGPVKFAGESTLGHVYEAFLQHLNKTEYFWPTRHDLDARKVYGRLDLIRAQGDHSDFHGIDMVNKNLFNEIHSHRRTANVKFENVVILQGANDAARYSIEKFREKMKTFVETVKKYRETSNESEQIRLKRLVWVTAPTRHYKSSSGPGDSMCPNGSSSEAMRSCSAGNSGQAHTEVGATRWHGIESGTDANVPPNLYGTHERRQLLNQIAKKTLRENEKVLADEVYIVDYESLTAALPSDYNYDGEHWGCPWRSWENRRGSGYSCKGLANVVVSNIISHFLGCYKY